MLRCYLETINDKENGTRGVRMLYEDSPDSLEILVDPAPSITYVIASQSENPEQIDLYEEKLRNQLTNHYMLLCALLVLAGESEDAGVV